MPEVFSGWPRRICNYLHFMQSKFVRMDWFERVAAIWRHLADILEMIPCWVFVCSVHCLDRDAIHLFRKGCSGHGK